SPVGLRTGPRAVRLPREWLRERRRTGLPGWAPGYGVRPVGRDAEAVRTYFRAPDGGDRQPGAWCEGPGTINPSPNGACRAGRSPRGASSGPSGPSGAFRDVLGPPVEGFSKPRPRAVVGYRVPSPGAPRGPVESSWGHVLVSGTRACRKSCVRW